MQTEQLQVANRPISIQNLEQSYDYCWQIAKRHYENFPVASWVFPRQLRRHVAAIYAFARIADDFADIHRDENKLHQWREYLHRYPHTEGIPHPVFPALFHTITRFQLPIGLLDDLITAFLMDVQGFHPHTWEDLLHYSRYSANPIGRLMLHLMGRAEPPLLEYSDAICTALQLTNFWQDLSVDLPDGRCYLPQNELRHRTLQPELTVLQQQWTRFEPMFHSLIHRTATLYHTGLPLLQHLRWRFRWEIGFILHGGITILYKTRYGGKQILTHRPVLTIGDWLQFFLKPAYYQLENLESK